MILDPDEILKEIKTLSRDLNDELDEDLDNEEVVDLGHALIEKVARLNQWLSWGGHLPNAWTEMARDEPKPTKKLRLVGLTEIGKLAGVGNSAVHNWTWRYDDFPEPYARVSFGAIWLESDVIKWLHRNGRL